jgi:hypothetical protein
MESLASSPRALFMEATEFRQDCSLDFGVGLDHRSTLLGRRIERCQASGNFFYERL